MVKCAVSACPNGLLNVSRGILNRSPKRFFSFPSDPARVKVWLAALRETDRPWDSMEDRVICEDHFLPEDISIDGITSDAIPIMPPWLDGALGLLSPWAESSEEEDRWAAGGDDEEDEAVEDDVPADAGAPAAKQDPVTQKASGPKTSRDVLCQRPEVMFTRMVTRHDVSLGVLTQRFLELLLTAPDGSLDLRQVTTSLRTRRRRVYDITNVLDGISLIEKQSTNRIRWTGRCPISSFLRPSQQRSQREVENLKLVEDTLDGLIKTCAQQLFDMTDDTHNSAAAYVTHGDISRLGAFREQTVIVVKAPEETKLEVPAPTEDSIQVHLKGGKGPIVVLTCDVGSGEAAPGVKSECFVTLEESRITTSTLHTGDRTTRPDPTRPTLCRVLGSTQHRAARVATSRRRPSSSGF